MALAGSPGLTRSGAKARSKSRPATRPESSSASRNGPSVVPGNVVDWRTTSCPARRCSRMVAAALRTGPRSGSFERVIGVGTHTKMASASARPADSGVTIRNPPARPRWRRASSTSSIGDRPARSSATRRPLASTPVTVRPDSDRARARGRPTYPRPMTATFESRSMVTRIAGRVRDARPGRRAGPPRAPRTARGSGSSSSLPRSPGGPGRRGRPGWPAQANRRRLARR